VLKCFGGGAHSSPFSVIPEVCLSAPTIVRSLAVAPGFFATLWAQGFLFTALFSQLPLSVKKWRRFPAVQELISFANLQSTRTPLVMVLSF